MTQKIYKQVICSGMTIGTISIPAFTLCKHEMLFLKWPLDIGTREEKIFFKMLLKKYQVDCIKIFGNPVKIGLFSLNTSFFFTFRWRKWRNKTVFEYLQFFTKLTNDSIEEILCNLGISLSDNFQLLSMTERLLVEIEIALVKSNILIFSTDGLDPLGERRVVEYIKGKLSGISAICICYPLIGYRFGEDTCSNILDIDKTSIVCVECI